MQTFQYFFNQGNLVKFLSIELTNLGMFCPPWCWVKFEDTAHTQEALVLRCTLHTMVHTAHHGHGHDHGHGFFGFNG